MTAEQLHDALNSLPDDLLEATDALRQKERKQPILWKRLVPIAACFVLVLTVLYVAVPYLSRKAAPQESQMVSDEAMSEMEMAPAETCAPGEAAGEPEAPAQMAPEADGNRTFDEFGAPLAPDMEEVSGNSATAETPVVCYSYCIGAEEPDETKITVISTAGEWERYLAANPRLTEEGGFENRYGEEYFEKNQLIAVVTTAASSSVSYEADAIRRTGTGIWELTVIRYSPEWFTDDMTQQLLIVELPRMVEPEDTVTLIFTTVNG